MRHRDMTNITLFKVIEDGNYTQAAYLGETFGFHPCTKLMVTRNSSLDWNFGTPKMFGAATAACRLMKCPLRQLSSLMHGF